MNGYLGETPVDIATHPKYSTYTSADWAMLFITRYGQIDGEHHKTWVLDTVARILKGTPVTVTLARWENGHQEYFVEPAEPSEAYLLWREKMLFRDENGVPQYRYDEGIAP